MGEIVGDDEAIDGDLGVTLADGVLGTYDLPEVVALTHADQ